MSETSRYRNPVIISCGTAFSESDNSELLDRHSRYGVAFRDVCGDPAAVLTVLVSSSTPKGSLVAEREALRVYSLGPRKNPFTIGLAAGRMARKRGDLPYWIAGTPFREALAAITARRLSNGPLQIQAHGNFGELSFWRGLVSDRARWLVARLTFPRASSVRTVSPGQQKSLLSTFRIDPKISFVAPVPVNPVFFHPASDPKPDDGIFRIGWFGRLHRERGFQEWLREVRSVIEDHEQVELHIIGGGPHKRELQDEIAALFPNTKSIWWGQISGALLAEKVARLDLVVNSFRNETFGRGMLEAALQGVQVRAIDSPGIRYVIEITRQADRVLQVSSHEGLGDIWHLLVLTPESASKVLAKLEADSVGLLVSSWCELPC
jgi:glycosyltransferase involved in cell wall biosynthesis